MRLQPILTVIFALLFTASAFAQPVTQPTTQPTSPTLAAELATYAMVAGDEAAFDRVSDRSQLSKEVDTALSARFAAAKLRQAIREKHLAENSGNTNPPPDIAAPAMPVTEATLDARIFAIRHLQWTTFGVDSSAVVGRANIAAHCDDAGNWKIIGADFLFPTQSSVADSQRDMQLYKTATEQVLAGKLTSIPEVNYFLEAKRRESQSPATTEPAK